MTKFRVLLPCIWAVLLLSCAADSSESKESSESTDSSESAESEIKLENGYIFTCPRSFKTGATNELQLMRFGDAPAGDFKVIIYYTDSYSSNESIAVQKDYTVEEGAKESYFELFLDKFEGYTYNGRISINGTFGEYNIGGSDKIYFSVSKDNAVFIQTDKPMYKKGQTVKFRVLSVDKDLTPTTDVTAEIYVEDPKGTRMAQWKDEHLEKGMQQFEFPLADEPVLGDWKVVVKIKEETTSTNFEVKEYVLPKFEVTIEIPPYVLVTAEEIEIKICAKYTYGKPVKGNLRLNVSLETFSWSSDKMPVLEYEEKIDGCLPYIINVTMIEPNDYYSYRRIQMVASVTEAGTDVERNETQYIQRQFSPLNLNFNSDQRQFYKPGLPYNGKLTCNNPDNTPAKDEGIQICYTVSRERVLSNWWATKKIKFCSNFTTDDEGVIEYIIPPQSTDSVGITIDAISLKYVKKDKGKSNRQNSLSQPQTSMTLTPWYSPSGSFIQLQPVQETLYCGSKKSFSLLFTSKTNADIKVRYQVLSQGSVVQSGLIEESFSTDDNVSDKYNDEKKLVNKKEVQILPPVESSRPETPEEECPSAREARYVPPVGEIKIELLIDASWSPSFQLLVYYIRDDRETIADSQKFKVEQCFKNQVKLQFGDVVKQPATKTSIRVSASPNSLCGIKVVDKSVALLNPDDQLTKEKVFRILESFDTGMYYGINHCNEEVPQPGLYRASTAGMVIPRPPQPWSSSKYEDALAAFENAGLLVISDMKMFTRPCKSRGGGNGNIVYEDTVGYGGGQAAPVVRKKVAMASTARRPRPPAAAMSDVVSKTGVEATKSVVEVRNYFPETWLFDLQMTGEDGEYLAKEKLPHTITEWVGSAVCINAQDGLGISNKTSIRGFQAFFLSFTLPYSIIRGEEFTLTVSVFSYVQDPMPITISMDELKGFELTGESIDGDICLQPGSSTNLKLKLKGKSLGKQNCTVRAETAQNSGICGDAKVSEALAKDAIENSIIVEPEGWPAEDIESLLFCPKNEENEIFKKQFNIRAPDIVVPDSGRAYIDYTGNVLGKSLDNLDSLVTMPTGCGEQNMVKFAPNVVAMDVLIETNQLTEKMKSKISKNLNLGAQRQLQYMHPDGSFSAFGTRDKEGSMFLTAFVLRYFSEAAKYVPMDNSTIVRMQNWIVSKQHENGCFPDVGKIIDRGLQGNIEKEKSEGTITAYVVTSLLISGYQNESVMDGAFSCIKDSQDTTFYATFLYAYAEALADKLDSAKERISSVKDKAITKEGAEHYHDVNATKPQDIETNALFILTVLKTDGGINAALPTLQYLTRNLNTRGGFYSTQDTCVGMEALGEFAKLTFKDPVDIRITCNGGGLQEEAVISEDEKLLVKRLKVPEIPSEVECTGTGTGCALIQKIVRYNTPTPPEKRSFNLEVNGQCLDSVCKKGSITVSLSYIPEGKSTGMSLVELKMISGMVPDTESLEKLLNDETLELMRYDVENNKVVFYFKQIRNTKIIFTINVEQVVAVENAQPGTAESYDYYNRDISSATTYSFKEL